jgi:hypothetical protein
MRYLAMEYIDVLPKLEWILVGGHPMKVKTIGGIRTVDCVAPMEKRDSSFSYLRRVFAGEGEEEGLTWKIR